MKGFERDPNPEVESAAAFTSQPHRFTIPDSSTTTPYLMPICGKPNSLAFSIATWTRGTDLG